MSDTDWYLLDRGGRRYGPYDRELVEGLAAKRELRAATPVWHPGLARWQPASRVLTLPVERGEASATVAQPTISVVARQSAPRATPERAQAQRASAQRAATPRVPQHPAPGRAPPARVPPSRAVPRSDKSIGAAAAKPAVKIPATPMTQPQAVRRAIAALLDLLCIVVVYRMFGGALPETPQGAIGRAAPLLLLWAALDAAATVRLGSTPGRALMGIRIAGAEERALSWPRALLRSGALPLLLLLLSLRAGFTFFIGVVALVLTARRVRAGFAPWWDDITGARVSYAEISAARGVVAVVAFVIGVIIVALA